MNTTEPTTTPIADDYKEWRISTPRMLIRPLVKDDLSGVVKIMHNPTIFNSTLNVPYPYTMECAEMWFATHEAGFLNNTSYTFGLFSNTTNELVGTMAIGHSARFHHGEVAYTIDEQFWNTGLCTEALKALIKWAFEEKGYHKVFGRFFTANPASGAVMKKVGMIHEGVLREHVQKNGVFYDLGMYGILRKDWDAMMAEEEEKKSRKVQEEQETTQ